MKPVFKQNLKQYLCGFKFIIFQKYNRLSGFSDFPNVQFINLPRVPAVITEQDTNGINVSLTIIIIDNYHYSQSSL